MKSVSAVIWSRAGRGRGIAGLVGGSGASGRVASFWVRRKLVSMPKNLEILASTLGFGRRCSVK